MARVIIGIHGLANKPRKTVMADWWKRSIAEGLRKNEGIRKPRFRFEMVYWADLLYKYPQHLDASFDFDKLYNDQPYIPARPGALKRYTYGRFDRIRANVNEVVLRGIEGLKDGLGLGAWTDSILQQVMRDLIYYWDPTRKIPPRSGRRQGMAKVLDQECRRMLLRYRDREIMLIGHSMGGAIALNYAANYPQHVARLILIDAAGILHRAVFSTHLFDALKPAWWWDTIPATNSEKLHALLGFDIADLEKYPLPLESLLNTPVARQVFLGGNPAKIAGLALVEHNFSGQLTRVTAPTLIIWGEHDPVAPLRTGKLLAARISDARLEVIRGAGHVPMRQKPRELNQLVLNELAGQPAPPRQTRLTNQLPEATTDSKRTARCAGENNQYISGNYTTVTIVQCEHVLIENATIDFLDIRGSSVELNNSRIGGKSRALQITDSVLVTTATDFSADIPLVVADSRLDFAAATITAGERPVEATGTSTALFSITELETPGGKRWLHGVIELPEPQALR